MVRLVAVVLVLLAPVAQAKNTWGLLRQRPHVDEDNAEAPEVYPMAGEEETEERRLLATPAPTMSTPAPS